jgi:hypothetical protein
MDGKHEFHRCWQFGNAYEGLSCENSELQPIAAAFIRNMNRVRGIGTLSINLITVSIVNEAARVEALANKKIPFHDPRILYGHPNFDSELFSEVDQERKRLINQWAKDDPKFHERMIKAGVQGMNIIIDENEAQSWDAVQATMAAMLIGLWTAFESLAQDTWIAAVNARAIPLAQRVLEPGARLGTGEQLKSVSWKVIVTQGFNLRTSMGETLLRQRAVDFQQLKTVRAAYNVAFDGQLEPVFQEHHVELFRLETVRNLFVHKGGLVDRKFIERMGNEPDMKDKLGRSLSVSGEYVASKANVVSRCSTQLIQAVDKWLIENPESTTAEA